MAQHTSPEPRSLFQNAILTGSSWFGSGYFPKAPGTWGTVAAIPFWWLLAGLGPVLYAVVVAVFCGVAVYFSHEAEKIYGGHDSKKIVIDEVAGLLVAGLGVPFLWPHSFFKLSTIGLTLSQDKILPLNICTISGYALNGHARGMPSLFTLINPARVGSIGSAVTTKWGRIPELINFLYGLLLATIIAFD